MKLFDLPIAGPVNIDDRFSVGIYTKEALENAFGSFKANQRLSIVANPTAQKPNVIGFIKELVFDGGVAYGRCKINDADLENFLAEDPSNILLRLSGEGIVMPDGKIHSVTLFSAFLTERQ